ncbi:hypothetical protein GJ744_003813 [Endocarpon pusillum]|uniref:Uncharacterized protein n=1 Tax=Endocarpon pusillum TaxID=364733 RepID=A0A8H7AM07_9EURO|nr:hypothetical protein GJ744_003813 [Endocarpon pusillum]
MALVLVLVEMPGFDEASPSENTQFDLTIHLVKYARRLTPLTISGLPLFAALTISR